MGWNKITKGFRVSLPDGWEDRSVYTFMGPPEAGETPMINVVVDDAPGTDDVTEYGRLSLGALLDTMPDAELLLERTIALKNDLDAYEVVLNWAPTEDKVIFIKNIYLLRDERGYTFTGRFSKHGYRVLGRLVDTVCNEFEPLA